MWMVAGLIRLGAQRSTQRIDAERLHIAVTQPKISVVVVSMVNELGVLAVGRFVVELHVLSAPARIGTFVKEGVARTHSHDNGLVIALLIRRELFEPWGTKRWITC
jgi:hypothetical protein